MSCLTNFHTEAATIIYSIVVSPLSLAFTEMSVMKQPNILEAQWSMLSSSRRCKLTAVLRCSVVNLFRPWEKQGLFEMNSRHSRDSNYQAWDKRCTETGPAPPARSLTNQLDSWTGPGAPAQGSMASEKDNNEPSCLYPTNIPCDGDPNTQKRQIPSPIKNSIWGTTCETYW